MRNNPTLPSEIEEVKKNIIHTARVRLGKELSELSTEEMYTVVAFTIQESLVSKWADAHAKLDLSCRKELYYLSFEFLTGRVLGNNLINLSEQDAYRYALEDLGFSLDNVEEVERDQALGNGGLGRLAACFLDSLATLGYPAYGCGIRYEYGLFQQKIEKGYQVEFPDDWLERGNPWEVGRPEEKVSVQFYGDVHEHYGDGRMYYSYSNTRTVIGIPYDTPISGYQSDNVGTMRLWAAKSPSPIDMEEFNRGNYLASIEEQRDTEILSEVLYPDDNHLAGKVLRLQQQYFFVSCTLQWMLARFKRQNQNLYELPQKIVIHINDTHPALAIPEMMRLLMDQEGLPWNEAWKIVTRIFAYTNHTIMPEALERWQIPMFKKLLPRIYMIVQEIDKRFRQEAKRHFPANDIVESMAIISKDYVNMANLCFVTCFSVNGVSQVHTEILVDQIGRHYVDMFPGKFFGITNGVTPRRWLKKANPALSELITKAIGGDFYKDASLLQNLASFAEDSSFQDEFKRVKQAQKHRFADYILEKNGLKVDPHSLFDVQVKRFHEYKRQMMNILHVMHRYNCILDGLDSGSHPQTFFFGGKAAPGYQRAKQIIKLINNVAHVVNNDPRTKGKLQVVFVENYGVSIAEKIISAAEVSEQISTAGKEASGTGNMKFMLNGALTVGTLDGANIEMLQQVGEENFYSFGLTVEEVLERQKRNIDDVISIYHSNRPIRRVLTQLVDGSFDLGDKDIFRDIYNSLLSGPFPDPYMIVRDLDAYIKIQEDINRDYQYPTLWYKKAILNVAYSGFFSSDRTIEEYVSNIWKLQRVP